MKDAMNRVQEIKHWLEEGNLYRAEKAIQNCSDDLSPEEREEFEKLLNEISVRHYRLLAGKAVISKDESLLKICVQKLREKNAPVEGLQNSLNQIISERRTARGQKMLVILFGLLAVVFTALYLLA
jgi:2-phospho-L-lactate guanylyltransferase (CobY/MobA/RfbA family)